MSSHRLKVYFDESTGAVRIQHECEVEIAGHKVRWSKLIDLDRLEAKGKLYDVLVEAITENREDVERQAMQAAVQHVAATGGRSSLRAKVIKVGGTMSPEGEAQP